MMDMKRIYNILLIMILSLFLLPLGGCFDSDINRSMYEADGEEMQRENHIVGATLKGMQGLVIPTREHLYQFMDAMAGGALFGETISNPSLEVLDIEKFARIAHSHGVPLIVDNTFPTPINCRPFEWGADIVVHSTTKYMDGHATSVGGCIVDSGNFDWDAHAEKFPGLCTPDESYHGLTYTKAFGKGAYITKATAQLMRDLGSIQSPQNSFLLNLGLETLHLRMPQHCRNAQKVAEYLSKNEKVAWVNYCGLPDNKYYSLAQKYMPNGSCGVISFGLKGGRDVSIKFMDSLEFIAIVTHVADARSCVLHPASHTHRQLTDEQLMEAGVRPDLIRLSVGIENADDIIADIEQALNA